jgi:hypothetical protein
VSQPESLRAKRTPQVLNTVEAEALNLAIYRHFKMAATTNVNTRFKCLVLSQIEMSDFRVWFVSNLKL